MAQRYGGQFSPDGDGPKTGPRPERRARGAFDGARVTPAGARSNLMFLPPLILAFTALGSGAGGLAAGLLGAASLLLGAWLLREGLNAEAAFHDRKVARRPSIPRKLFAALACGAGTALAAWKSDPGMVAPVIYGVAAGALHIGAFGIDPMRNKGFDGVDAHQQDRVARVVDEAEKHLTAMREAVARAGDRQVEARVERFQVKVRQMIRTVEDDPRDLTAARKFLGVYLMGARDAAIKFADIYARSRDETAKSDFMMLLTDLEETFGAKTERLLIDNNTDLTVEIDVLRERLQREGVVLNGR